uniref:Protein kinase domain-containing protein n=1 Tax=Leersia perrieri TaxID=77586 RepID=A0A0D9UWI6_9ORYZ
MNSSSHLANKKKLTPTNLHLLPYSLYQTFAMALQLLPAIIVASLLHVATATGSNGKETSGNISCTPARCGNLTIRYPFSLGGVQPAYCGYPVLDLTCDNNGTAYLSRTFRDHLYRIDNIFYENSSLVAAVQTNFNGDNGCPVPDFNVTSSLNPYPFIISNTNSYLVVVYNCTLPDDNQLQRPCANQTTMGAYISDQWNSSTRPSGIPGNCTSVSVPVRSGVKLANQHYAQLSADGFSGAVGGGAVDSSGKTRPVNQQYDRLISDGFLLEWMRSVMGDQDCDECTGRGGECRFSQLKFQCFCPDGLLCSNSTGTNSTSSHPSSGTDRSHRKHQGRLRMIAFVTATAGLFTCLIWIMHRQKQRLSFSIRCKYAGNESNEEQEKLGEGGYGMVFKGSLLDGRMVAVKLLKGSKGNGEEFLNEGSKRALVYEYMANGSLGKYIYSENLRSAIGLESLQKIAIGVARGLEYLHQGCSTRIIHFDIKPHNILLDEDYCPKIADFGLAKLCHLKDSALSMAEARGTIGFIAPEVFSRGFGVVSTKSDVYSYGMMLLEMIEGRKNVNGNTDKSSAYFPNWIYDHLVKDLRSHEVASENEEIARKITLVGLWCIQTAPGNRPSMSKVIEMLEKNINELEVPPKPILSCLPVPPHFSSSS